MKMKGPPVEAKQVAQQLGGDGGRRRRWPLLLGRKDGGVSEGPRDPDRAGCTTKTPGESFSLLKPDWVGQEPSRAGGGEWVLQSPLRAGVCSKAGQTPSCDPAKLSSERAVSEGVKPSQVRTQGWDSGTCAESKMRLRAPKMGDVVD